MNENSWFRESADVPAPAVDCGFFSVETSQFHDSRPRSAKNFPSLAFFYLRPSRRVSIRRPVFPFSANPTNRSPPNFPKSRKNLTPLGQSVRGVGGSRSKNRKLEKLELKEGANNSSKKKKNDRSIGNLRLKKCSAKECNVVTS